MAPEGGGNQRPRVQAVERALLLLDALCHSDDGLSLGALAGQTGLHKTTAHRLLRPLIQYRFVIQDPATKRYRVGLKLFELAQMVTSKLELRSAGFPELRELSRLTNETVHLAVLDDGDVIYIDKHETQRTIRMFSAIGKRGPAHCTGVGKILLAALPDEELQPLIARKGLRRFTAKTITSWPRLRAELNGVRRRGYAIDDTEHEPEIRCVACPIRNQAGEVIAAISLTVPAMRISREEIEKMAPRVGEYADHISQKLGYSRAVAGAAR